MLGKMLLVVKFISVCLLFWAHIRYAHQKDECNTYDIWFFLFVFVAGAIAADAVAVFILCVVNNCDVCEFLWVCERPFSTRLREVIMILFILTCQYAQSDSCAHYLSLKCLQIKTLDAFYGFIISIIRAAWMCALDECIWRFFLELCTCTCGKKRAKG